MHTLTPETIYILTNKIKPTYEHVIGKQIETGVSNDVLLRVVGSIDTPAGVQLLIVSVDNNTISDTGEYHHIVWSVNDTLTVLDDVIKDLKASNTRYTMSIPINIEIQK